VRRHSPSTTARRGFQDISTKERGDDLQTQIIQKECFVRSDMIPFAGKEVEPMFGLPKGTERRLACLARPHHTLLSISESPHLMPTSLESTKSSKSPRIGGGTTPFSHPRNLISDSRVTPGYRVKCRASRSRNVESSFE
jgi:hypothetical protein